VRGVFVYALLGADHDSSPYTQIGDRVARIAAGGVQLVIEELRTAVTKTRKDGSRGRLRYDYGDLVEPAQPPHDVAVEAVTLAPLRRHGPRTAPQRVAQPVGGEDRAHELRLHTDPEVCSRQHGPDGLHAGIAGCCVDADRFGQGDEREVMPRKQPVVRVRLLAPGGGVDGLVRWWVVDNHAQASATEHRCEGPAGTRPRVSPAARSVPSDEA
jgi:hypothetical protein